MEFIDLVTQRCSIRNYSSKNIDRKDLDYVMECVRLAPSAVNRQPWHFYICETPESLHKVRQCYLREWFATAPCVIIACVCHEEEWIRQSDGRPHGIVDLSIAVEHLCLAATEKGLGTCWVCNFDVQKTKELFDLPQNIEPVVLIPIGHPEMDISEKNRKLLENIVTEL
ncbi:MAG TPA: nitroreductase [Prevotellaceae bacterium]|jgi:nitroreductase|nr:nitroreductase [Prevotellaceae bacterium]